MLPLHFHHLLLTSRVMCIVVHCIIFVLLQLTFLAIMWKFQLIQFVVQYYGSLSSILLVIFFIQVSFSYPYIHTHTNIHDTPAHTSSHTQCCLSGINFYVNSGLEYFSPAAGINEDIMCTEKWNFRKTRTGHLCSVYIWYVDVL